MNKLECTLTTLLIFLFHSAVYSHGIITKQIKGGIGVQFNYADDSPVSFSDVTVYSPEGEEYQNGVTDTNGCFLFLPGTAGEWKIKVDDGMGHSATESLTVTEDFELKIDNTEQLPVYYKIIFGVCILFGLSGVIFLFGSKRQREN